jgi:Fe2+ or Zn2+ uptake regulation protein
MVDLELSIPKKLLEEAANRSKFKPEKIELTLRGLCPECSKQAEVRVEL